MLRRIKLRGPRHPIHLVTTLLDRRAFPDVAALDVYRRRWGVETFVRTFKQTFGRGRLRSGSPTNARNELAWSLVALWCPQLPAARDLVADGLDPTRLGTANSLRAMRTALAVLVAAKLANRLNHLAALANDGWTRREKSTRDGLRKNRHGPPRGEPQLRYPNLDPAERRILHDHLP